MEHGFCIGRNMAQPKEITETWSPELNELITTLKDGGPSQEEFVLMGIIAIMDETLREISCRVPQCADAVYGTYYEVEEYILTGENGH